MKDNQINIIKVDNDTFVGLRFENERLNIYIPNLYNIEMETNSAKLSELSNKEEVKKQIFEFLKTLSLASLDNEQGLEDTMFTDKVTSSAFSSMRWLIMDFVKNGFYEEFGKKSVKDSSGKINWKKTMKQIPNILKNGDIYFHNLIVDKKIKVSKIIGEIYKYCLQLSIDCIGWVWNINAKVYFGTMLPSSTLTYYINVVSRELTSTFLDSKKEILSHLLNILRGVNVDTQDAFSYGVKSYHTVFEAMIDKMFGNVSDKSKFYPRATWNLVLGGEKQASKLRPDTIMNGKNAYYILDAKYYDTIDGEYNNLPSSSDIQKQITYGAYLEKRLKNNNNHDATMESNVANEPSEKKIYNAFILPCDIKDSYISKLKNNEVNLSDNEQKDGKSKTDLVGNMVYFGYAEADWVDGTQSYEKIIGLYIDLKFLINNYQTKRVEGLEEILQNIIPKIGQLGGN